MTSYLLG
jgi:hypothetical protein